MSAASEMPRLSRDALITEYEGYGVPRTQFRVGGEFERHLLRPDGHPVPYFGEHGVHWLLQRLAARGWDPYVESEWPIALRKGPTWITLEPGGQFELSGAPFATASEVMAQARAFVAEVDEAIGDAALRQVALGYTPYARIDDIEWVPKGRYGVMRGYLGRTGDLAHAMMKGTAAVQASFDFADEADAARKVGLAVRLGPLTTATFANSPLVEGAPVAFQTWRGHVWTRTDPARTGFPAAAWEFSFERWVDYLLDVPMMFTKLGGQWADAKGLTFRQWVDAGIDGAFPTRDDWDLHLTSVFPEVRIKRTIEVRGADCVPLPLAGGFVALFRTLLYEDRATDAATEVAQRFASHGTQAERFEVACRDGLGGTIGGRRLADWAGDLVAIAEAACPDVDRPLLDPLAAQVATGESPAAATLRAWRDAPDRGAFLDAVTYRP